MPWPCAKAVRDTNNRLVRISKLLICKFSTLVKAGGAASESKISVNSLSSVANGCLALTVFYPDKLLFAAFRLKMVLYRLIPEVNWAIWARPRDAVGGFESC